MTNTLDELVISGAETYIRYLVAAEQAVVQGNFNLAKALRALAYSHRATALTVGRAQAAKPPSTTKLLELDQGRCENVERLLDLLRQQSRPPSTDRAAVGSS